MMMMKTVGLYHFETEFKTQHVVPVTAKIITCLLHILSYESSPTQPLLSLSHNLYNKYLF